MRSIVGPLLFGLLPLVGAGCVLPDRSIEVTEKFGFRTGRMTPPRVASDSSSQESISFRTPEKNQTEDQDNTHRQSQFSDETNLFDDSTGVDHSILIAGHSSDTAARSVGRGPWPSSKDSSPGGYSASVHQPKTIGASLEDSNSTEDLTHSSIRNARYRSDIDDTANPIQLQNRESEHLNSQSKSQVRPFDVNETPGDNFGNGSGSVKKPDPSTSTLPMWSDRTSERNSVRQASGSIMNSKMPVPVQQISQTESTSNRFRSSSSGSLQSLPWQAELDQLISRVEQDLSQMKSTEGNSNESLRRHAHLRLLYLMAQRQEDAMTAIPGIDALQQEYWQQMVWAMSNTFDTVQYPDPSERASQVVPPLSSALRQMREQAALSIKNMTFCRKISYFGNYERFSRNNFTAGHEVLLYTEIENFVSTPTADGEYRTSLKSLIEIADSRGKIVWTKGFPSTEDFCRNPRRDYFHNYQFFIPEDLSTGAYTLRLTIIDELSKKQASNSLNFVLK